MEEEWRPVPGFAAEASSFGRVRGAKRAVITPSLTSAGQLRVYIYRLVDEPIQRRGRTTAKAKSRNVSVAGCVATAFGIAPTAYGTLRYADGDKTNCRPENLSVPARTPSGRISIATGAGPKPDLPWTKADDKKLRTAATENQAIRTSRHTRKYTLDRIAFLGLDYGLGPKVTALADRDLVAVVKAISLLEQHGVSDRAINLAINIEETARRSPEIADAKIACVLALKDAGWTRKQIAVPFGWDQRTVGAWLLRAGRVARPWSGPSAAGYAETLPGEEWRPCGWGYQVSNLGRVQGIARGGGILAHRIEGQSSPSVVLVRPEDRLRSERPVASLVLSAFRPDVPFRRMRHVYRNGDSRDVRLVNLLPTPSAQEQRDIEKACRAAVPGWITGQAIREDLAQDALVLMLEGLAITPAAAMQKAIKRHNALTGNDLAARFGGNLGRSLETQLGEGLTLGDLVNSEGVISRLSQKSKHRS